MSDLERSLRGESCLCGVFWRRALLSHLKTNSAGYKRACHVSPGVEGALGFDLLLKNSAGRCLGHAALGGCVGANWSSLIGAQMLPMGPAGDKLEGFNLEFCWTPTKRTFLEG